MLPEVDGASLLTVRVLPAAKTNVSGVSSAQKKLDEEKMAAGGVPALDVPFFDKGGGDVLVYKEYRYHKNKASNTTINWRCASYPGCKVNSSLHYYTTM